MGQRATVEKKQYNGLSVRLFPWVNHETSTRTNRRLLLGQGENRVFVLYHMLKKIHESEKQKTQTVKNKTEGSWVVVVVPPFCRKPFGSCPFHRPLLLSPAFPSSTSPPKVTSGCVLCQFLLRAEDSLLPVGSSTCYPKKQEEQKCFRLLCSSCDLSFAE